MMIAECTKPKFQLGLLLDSPLASKYVVEFVERSQSHEGLEISHLFILSPKPTAEHPRLPYSPLSMKTTCSAISDLFFRLIVGIERLFLLKNERHHNHLQKFDLSALLPNSIVHKLREDEVCSVHGLELDLLVTFATRNSFNGIRNAAKLGVVSVSHSDDYIGRDGPAGFWEVYFRRDVTGFTVQRLADSSDERKVLMRGRVGTEFYYLLNQAALLEKSHYYLFKLVERMITTGELPKFEPNWPACHIPRGVPSIPQALLYLIGLTHLTVGKILEKARWFKRKANVAFVPENWRNAVLCRAAVIDNPRQHYLADPFLITRDGTNFCYVEDYDEVTERGRITVYALGSRSANYVGVALEESFHLSYPYLFEYAGDLYMCPETSENWDIRIYKCVDFPLRWELKKIIMKNVSAVDSMLFERNGRWWMLTNIDPARWGDHSLELCLFSAKSPFEEQWIPHPGNPFFINSSRTRNGGIIREGDRLFRVAQGKGFDMYGKQTSVNEIIELNEKDYVEQRVCVIAPEFRKHISGTHHLHSNGTVTVIDFFDGGF